MDVDSNEKNAVNSLVKRGSNEGRMIRKNDDSAEMMNSKGFEPVIQKFRNQEEEIARLRSELRMTATSNDEVSLCFQYKPCVK